MSGSVNMETRYSFSVQFLLAAADQSRSAFEIEGIYGSEISEECRARHRGYVVGAIMQTVAALESEVWEVMVYGPGNHLGSNGTDVVAQQFLSPLADLVDRQDVVSRYTSVLHLLGKPPIASGGHVYDDVLLVVKLRNELTHYKSKWGSELDRKKLIRSLQAKRHRRPSFQPASGMSFFPNHCLSAECAAWAVDSTVTFLNQFYENLGLQPRLTELADRLKARP